MNEYRFQALARPGGCRSLAGEVVAVLARHLRHDEPLDDLELALTEALANVVRHAYSGTEGGEMRVTLRLFPGSMVELEVADRGHGLPDEVRRRLQDPEPPVPDAHAEGGRGLFILRSLADDIAITTRDSWNVLLFRKHVEPAAWK